MVVAILLVSGTPSRLLVTATGVAATLGLLAIYLEPYRRQRFFSFLNPWHDAQGAGFQTVQAMIGLGSGGIFGVGLGQGVQKIFYLPEAHTDMIFAIIGEELGLLGATAVIAAYALFAYAGLKIALGCRDPFGKRLAAGLTALASVGILLNIAGSHGATARAEVSDRRRGDGRPRHAVARRGGGAARPRRAGDVRRVAGSRRGAARP